MPTIISSLWGTMNRYPGKLTKDILPVSGVRQNDLSKALYVEFALKTLGVPLPIPH